MTCWASDQCHTAGSCDTLTGACSNPAKPDGASCSDGNACTSADICLGGTCSGSPLPPPTEIDDSVRLTLAGTTATITWTDDPGPFNVYRGQVSSPTPWSYNQVCLAASTFGPATDDQAPPAGSAFFYLVTRKDACGESSPGHASDGTPIANNSACIGFALARSGSTPAGTIASERTR